MEQIHKLGDIVLLRRNKHIWADEKGYYIITKLDKMIPIEIQALTKSNTHFEGEIISHKNLNQLIHPIKIKSSDTINKETFLWMKETNSLQPSTIVHFIGNNRELEFIIIEGKLVSNIEFEFYTKPNELTKGRIGIALQQKKTILVIHDKITESIKKIALCLHLI
jgi:hypothetical protein